MKAIKIFAPNDVKIINIPKPIPQYGEVVCKVIRTGICATDYAIYSGAFSAVKKGMVKFPLQPGHEWSGIVENIGPGVKLLKPGDRVIGDTAISCGKCYDCITGNYLNCKYLQPVGTINAWDGAMAEYVLFPERHLFKIPDSVTFDNAALVEPAATAMYAIHNAPVKPGDSMVVIGTGPIGMAAACIGRIYGASQIIGIGRNDYKLELFKKLGATDVINSLKEDVISQVNKLTAEEGVNIIIEASGSIDLFNSCIKMARRGGTIAVVAFYDTVTMFDVDEMIFKAVKYLPVPGGFGMFRPLLKLMEHGQIDLTPVISHRCTLDESPKEIANLKVDKNKKIKVMICNDKF